MPGSSNEFSGLEENYRRYRPSYPAEVFTEVGRYHAAGWSHREAPVLADIGAGTGISTRQLADAFEHATEVIGVEPGEGMRATASGDAEAQRQVRYMAGSAEQLPFADDSIGVVLAAQALQWFDRPRFYAEARRVLRSSGVLAILQNNRSWQRSAFLAEYESFLESHGPAYRRDYRAFPIEQELSSLNGFGAPLVLRRDWVRQLSGDEFLGMAFSSTKTAAAMRSIGEADVSAAIRDLIRKHCVGEQVALPYTTELFMVRRANAFALP